MSSAEERLFAERHVNPDAISVPPGFCVEIIATGLNNPSSIDFDEEGNIFIAEMGSPTGSAYAPGRVVRIRPDGSSATIADDFLGSITGLAFYRGTFLVAEHAHSNQIYRLQKDGVREILVGGLPGGGDHPTSDVVVAHSERIYFGQGTRTNSGVVGTDNAEWLSNHPELFDIPGKDIILAGKNFKSHNLFGPGSAVTGAFKPFGVLSTSGELIAGSIKSNGSILRISPDGGEFELFAWGLRNPFGMAVHSDGRIFCTDTGMHDHGSRPIADGRGYIWHVERDGWYGWPDYAGGDPVTDLKFHSRTARPEFLLKERPPIAGKPVACLPAGLGMAKMDFSRSPLFGSDDTLFIALTGELVAKTGNHLPGFKVITVDIATGATDDFMKNLHPGPASAHGSGGLERPVAVKFDRTGESMYVLDLGVLNPERTHNIQTLPNTGVTWRVRPSVIA